MFRISSSPTRRKTGSALAVLAAMGASGMAARSDAATEYAPSQSAWTANSAYAWLGGDAHWLNFSSIPVDANDSGWRSIAGAGGSYGPARAWFDWSMPGLGTSFNVSQATLKVHALGGYYGIGIGRTVAFGLVTDNWDATKPVDDPANNGAGAWNAGNHDGNGPNLVGADGNPNNLLIYTSTTDGGTFDVNVTSLLQAWAANPTLYHGIGAYSPDTANSYGGIDAPNSTDFPGITGHLFLDQVSLGPTNATWTSASAGDWNTSGNWSGGVPNGVDHQAHFLGAISTARTVFTDTPVTVGTLHFNNANMYHITGAGTLTLQVTDDTTTPALIDVDAGTHKINLPMIVASNTNLDVASGATLKISDPVTINSGKSLTPIGSGTVTYESTVTLLSSSSIAFNSSQHVAALTVGDNATATLNQNGSRVLQADSLSISSSGGKVDLKNNAMLFRGQGAGTWNGTAYTGVSGLVATDKVTTSMPDAATLLTTIGVGTDGNGDTHAVYTYSGDSNIDGVVDGDDFAAIDAGFSANAKLFSNGDFDYSGKIDADDYFLIDRSYAKQTTPFGPGAVAGGITAVPEPASIGLLGIGAASILIRRRRRA